MCCQITTPGRSIKKPRQHQTFAIEKFRDLIVTTRSCPGDKNISLMLNYHCLRIHLQQTFILDSYLSIYLNNSVLYCCKEYCLWVLVRLRCAALNASICNIAPRYTLIEHSSFINYINLLTVVESLFMTRGVIKFCEEAEEVKAMKFKHKVVEIFSKKHSYYVDRYLLQHNKVCVV